MPWQILDLDPAAATAKDVKRAYAKQLKTCRPDQDPEGFRRLHEAYTEALGELQWRETPGGMPAAPGLHDLNEMPVSTEAAVADAVADAVLAVEAPRLSPGLEAVVDVMDRLETALKDRGEGVAGLVREAESVLHSHPSEVQRWGEMLHDLIRDHGKHDDLRLKPEAILFELEHNGVAATIAVIDRLDRQGNPRAIQSLSALFTGNGKRIATPAGGIACARLAGAAAFWAPGAVEQLANLAYEYLARGERDFHMQMIDHHAGMRGFLSMAPEALRSFLRQRLMDAGGSEVWDGEEGAAVLRWLKTPQARAGPVYEVIRKMLPDHVAAGVGLPAVEPETITLSSSADTPRPRVVRPAPSKSSRLPKPVDELEWEEYAEIPDPPEPVPRREKAPRSAPKPASPPAPAPERTNWLDLENRSSREPSFRRPQVDSGRAGSRRYVTWATVVVVIVVKIILIVLKNILEGGL